MTVFLSTDYEIVNNKAVEVRLDIASHQIRVLPGATVNFRTPNRVAELPDIPDVTITPTNLPDVYIPFGGFLREDEVIGVGDNVALSFTGTMARPDIDKGSLSITDTVEIFTDTDGDGVMIGDQGGTGQINYRTGEFSITFDVAPANLQNIEATYLHRENETIR